MIYLKLVAPVRAVCSRPCQFDARGYLPAWLINAAAVEQSLNLARIRDCAEAFQATARLTSAALSMVRAPCASLMCSHVCEMLGDKSSKRKRCAGGGHPPEPAPRLYGLALEVICGLLRTRTPRMCLGCECLGCAGEGLVPPEPPLTSVPCGIVVCDDILGLGLLLGMSFLAVCGPVV
jgi:hypothetical protein